MGDLARAALGLELSDREIRCPKKGVLAIARCEQLQAEFGCTCLIYLYRTPKSAGAAPAPAPAPAPPARAPAPQPPAPDRRQLIASRARARHANEEEKMPVALTTKSGKGAVLAAMQAEPERVFTTEEILHLYRGSAASAKTCAIKMARDGILERTGPGHYRLADGEQQAPAPEKPASEEETPASPKKRRAPKARRASDADQVLGRLRWLAEGLQAGHLAEGDFVNYVLDAIGARA